MSELLKTMKDCVICDMLTKYFLFAIGKKILQKKESYDRKSIG